MSGSGYLCFIVTEFNPQKSMQGRMPPSIFTAKMKPTALGELKGSKHPSFISCGERGYTLLLKGEKPIVYSQGQ